MWSMKQENCSTSRGHLANQPHQHALCSAVYGRASCVNGASISWQKLHSCDYHSAFSENVEQQILLQFELVNAREVSFQGGP